MRKQFLRHTFEQQLKEAIITAHQQRQRPRIVERTLRHNAVKRLMKHGYSEEQAVVIVRDVADIAHLELNAED